MGLFVLLRKAFGLKGKGFGVDELARRLGDDAQRLESLAPSYREFSISKRSGGTRVIHAPDDVLKKIQRRLLQRVFGKLKIHVSAVGFERGRSIVHNAATHAGKAVVVRMDVKDFFASTRVKRIRRYFRTIGWNHKASDILVKLTTHNGGLPQGAPTSPRLSNLVNFQLDHRLSGLARVLGAVYTRYADDITFSFATDDRRRVQRLVHTAKDIIESQGYRLHMKKKLSIRRRHNRQIVTGLVVNDGVNLPRRTRRWLRAVEHRIAMGGEATLTPEELAGWKSLQAMVEAQR